MSYVVFMNFVKYLKDVFEQDVDKVRIEHLVVILETSLKKRNEITIENIMADQILHYLLSKMNNLMKK